MVSSKVREKKKVDYTHFGIGYHSGFSHSPHARYAKSKVCPLVIISTVEVSMASMGLG